MIHRHLSLPHRFVLVTDQLDADYDPLIERVPLWDDWRDLGNPTWATRSACYPRLKLFSRKARELFGDRIVCMDIDCVATAPLDPLFDRDEDFVILRRTPLTPNEEASAYHGALWMLRAGTRPQVWEDFRGGSSIAAARKYIGSDQAWICHRLPNEAGWTQNDGVYCSRNLEYAGRWPNIAQRSNEQPPKNARLVFFNSGTKPWEYGKAGKCRECGMDIGHAVRVLCHRCKTVNIQQPGSWVAEHWQ